MLCPRMRNDRRGGAWCPRKPISATDYEWIEVDLESVKVITEIETQGRLGNGQVGTKLQSHNLETSIALYVY